MSIFVRVMGTLSVLLCIGTSMLMNWRFGVSQGGNEFEAMALGMASVAFDIGKVVSAWMLAEHLANGRWVKAFISTVFVVLLTAWGLQSALGFVSETRSEVVGGREATRATFTDAERELNEALARRDQIKTLRGQGPIEAEIAGELATPVKDGKKVRGSVDKVSENCTIADMATVEACRKIGTLRQELANAVEATRLDRRVSELRGKLATLRAQGGTRDANPQASLISRLSQGWLSMSSIVLAQSLLLPVLLELWAAFGLVVVIDGGARVRRGAERLAHAHDEREVAAGAPVAVEVVTPPVAPATLPRDDATRRGVARRRLSSPDTSVGTAARFLNEGLVAAEGDVVPRSRLFGLYKAWCEARGLQPLVPDVFVKQFVAACQQGGMEWVTQNGEPCLVGRRQAA